MSGFTYLDGQLHADQVPLAEIADAVGTPAYVYAGAVMRARLRQFLDAFADRRVMVCYALKANSNLAVIRTLAEAGAGADIVSGGELQRALAAGVPPQRIVFSGVGKSREEMAQALDAGIAQFNVESVPELIALGEVAAARRTSAPVALRVNPDVAADTHDRISTGRRHDKFGIAYDQALEVYETARRLAGIELVGLHLHIGSQILSLAPFEAAYRRGIELVHSLRAAGIALRRLDLGGGFGVPYGGQHRFDLAAYAALVRRLSAGLDLAVQPPTLPGAAQSPAAPDQPAGVAPPAARAARSPASGRRPGLVFQPRPRRPQARSPGRPAARDHAAGSRRRHLRPLR